MIPIAVKLKVALAFGAAALVVFALGYVVHLRQRAERAEGEAAKAHAAAAAAAAQSAVREDAAAIADRAQSKAFAITVRAQEYEHEIRTLPEAETPLPPALRDRVRSGVLGLRERSPAADAVDGPGGGEPAPAVPEAGR